MTKPFGVLELQARVRSLLRRHAPKAAPIIESQTLKIDKQTRTVMHNGQVMELTNKEYQLLLYLNIGIQIKDLLLFDDKKF